MPALAEMRSQRAGLMRASLPRKSRYGMRAVVRNSATCARSRSASSRSSSNPSARAAGSILGTPSRKNAGIPARSKADARWAAYAAGAAHQHGHLLEPDAARRLLEHEPRDLHGFERLAWCGEESNRVVERRRPVLRAVVEERTLNARQRSAESAIRLRAARTKCLHVRRRPSLRRRDAGRCRCAVPRQARRTGESLQDGSEALRIRATQGHRRRTRRRHRPASATRPPHAGRVSRGRSVVPRRASSDGHLQCARARAPCQHPVPSWRTPQALPAQHPRRRCRGACAGRPVRSPASPPRASDSQA